MDAPRWSAKSAVRKEDQFTVAPEFYDEHDSDHLPMWGRIGAAWHGMAPQRRVVLAASIFVIAGAFAALVVFAVADWGASPSGTPSGAPAGGLADQEAPGGLRSIDPSLPLQPKEDSSGGLLNATSSASSPLPLPSPTPG